MLPSQAAMIFSIAISLRLDAILIPPAYTTTGSIRGGLGLNSGLYENIWWHRRISTRLSRDSRHRPEDHTAGRGLSAALPTFSESTHSFVDLLAVLPTFRRKRHDRAVDISVDHQKALVPFLRPSPP